MYPIIDTHCHIYPDAIARKAVAGIGRFYNAPIVSDGRVDTMLTEGGAAGITHFVVSSVATTPHQVQSVNAFIAGTAAAHPGVVTGLGSLHPDSPDQNADVTHLLELGLSGVKLHPDIQQCAIDDPRYFRIFELCQGKLPVLCHLGDARFDFSNPDRVANVIRAFPRLKLIGAHFGGWSLWKQAARALCDFPHFVVDCSSSLFALTPAEGRELVLLYGAGRVLFGTDFPMWKPDEELSRFDALDLTQEERRRILFLNAAALFGIGPNENNG